jgi:vacuolar protein sorting-associated protein 35
MLVLSNQFSYLLTISNTPLDDVDMVGKLFAFIRPLIKDDSDTPGDDDEEEFQEEQALVARLVSLMSNSDTDVLFKIYKSARTHFGQGGVKRIPYTLVPLVFQSLKLTQLVTAREAEGVELATSSRKVLQFVHEIVTALAANCPDVSLKLFLQCALAADHCDFEAIAYEFVTQVHMPYTFHCNNSFRVRLLRRRLFCTRTKCLTARRNCALCP